jgi:hypothetical protein
LRRPRGSDPRQSRPLSALRAVLTCALLFNCATTFGQPTPSTSPNGTVAPPEDAALSRRIMEARQSGTWSVQEGDHLYRIARHFFPADRVMIERMREQLIAMNAHAFMAGKPNLLIVGARLKLPLALIAQESPSTQVTTVAQVPQPASMPSVAPKTGAAPSAPAASPALPAAAKPAVSPTPSASSGQTIITRLDPNAVVVAPPQARVAPAYVDKVIEGVSQDDEVDSDAAQSGQSIGRRTISLGHTQAIRERAEGTSRDSAIDLRLSYETQDHGDFRLDAQWIRFTPGPLDLLPQRRGFNATLYHSQFPLPAGLTADSALGVVRSLQPLWLSSSYRVVLPSTLLSGFVTRIGGDQGELRLAVGEPGRLAGVGILDFERTSGRFATVSGSRAFGSGWQLGGALLRLTDNDVVPDHTAATFAVDYAPSSALRGKTQLLSNAGGTRGYWSDWEVNHQRWRHRAGAYHLDPDLLYGDSQPQNDVRGAYWRTELRQGFNTYVVGAETSHTNIRNDPARSGTASDGVYGSVALRIDRNTSVGAGLSYREDRPRQGSGEARDVVIASAFGSRQSELGFSRLDGSINRTQSRDGTHERITTFQLSHDFPRWNQISASVSLSATREDLTDGRINRKVGGLSLRGPLLANMVWDATLSWVDVTGEGQSERGYNANVGVDWPISANWAANLSWQRNQVRPGVDNPLNPFRRENTVLLSVRYDHAVGVPYPRLSGPGGRLGTGTLAGFVFYDENGDGVRQPSERGAENILLVLDGRFTATSNREGFYNFGSVTLGTHSVAVQLEKVPLPWGLADESPRQIVVRLREESRIDIGLTRISP